MASHGHVLSDRTRHDEELGGLSQDRRAAALRGALPQRFLHGSLRGARMSAAARRTKLRESSQSRTRKRISVGPGSLRGGEARGVRREAGNCGFGDAAVRTLNLGCHPPD